MYGDNLYAYGPVAWPLTTEPPPSPAGPTASDTLRERFPRGEITREQFEGTKRSPH